MELNGLLTQATALTNEEVRELNVSAAQQKMGQIDQILTDLHKFQLEAEEDFSKASLTLKKIKITKSTLVERARNLKSFCLHY